MFSKSLCMFCFSFWCSLGGRACALTAAPTVSDWLDWAKVDFLAQHASAPSVTVPITGEIWMQLTEVLRLLFVDFDNLHQHLLLRSGASYFEKSWTPTLEAGSHLESRILLACLQTSRRRPLSSPFPAVVWQLLWVWRCAWNSRPGRRCKAQGHTNTLNLWVWQWGMSSQEEALLPWLPSVNSCAYEARSIISANAGRTFEKLSWDGRGNRGTFVAVVGIQKQYTCSPRAVWEWGWLLQVGDSSRGPFYCLICSLRKLWSPLLFCRSFTMEV